MKRLSQDYDLSLINWVSTKHFLVIMKIVAFMGKLVLQNFLP